MDDGILESSYPVTYDFQGHKVRVLTLEGEPWFVAIDVCRVLGFSRPDNMHRTLGEGERIHTPHQMRGDFGLTHRNVLISESGLYKLIMRSDKPEARPFQDWVTREVLPAIRKDGMYVMGEEKVRTGEMTEDEFILKAMTLLKGKAERLTEELAVTTSQRDHYQGIVQENLVELTLDAWKALNGHYLNTSDTHRLAALLRKKIKERGLTVSYESRELELKDGKVTHVELKQYPKELIDETALELGIEVKMKFGLVPLGSV